MGKVYQVCAAQLQVKTNPNIRISDSQTPRLIYRIQNIILLHKTLWSVFNEALKHLHDAFMSAGQTKLQTLAHYLL